MSRTGPASPAPPEMQAAEEASRVAAGHPAAGRPSQVRPAPPARATRLRIVPTGQPQTSAACSYVRSAAATSTSASRRSRGRRASASSRVTRSLASRAAPSARSTSRCCPMRRHRCRRWISSAQTRRAMVAEPGNGTSGAGVAAQRRQRTQVGVLREVVRARRVDPSGAGPPHRAAGAPDELGVCVPVAATGGQRERRRSEPGERTSATGDASWSEWSGTAAGAPSYRTSVQVIRVLPLRNVCRAHAAERRSRQRARRRGRGGLPSRHARSAGDSATSLPAATTDPVARGRLGQQEARIGRCGGARSARGLRPTPPPRGPGSRARDQPGRFRHGWEGGEDQERVDEPAGGCPDGTLPAAQPERHEPGGQQVGHQHGQHASRAVRTRLAGPGCGHLSDRTTNSIRQRGIDRSGAGVADQDPAQQARPRGRGGRGQHERDVQHQLGAERRGRSDLPSAALFPPGGQPQQTRRPVAARTTHARGDAPPPRMWATAASVTLLAANTAERRTGCSGRVAITGRSPGGAGGGSHSPVTRVSQTGAGARAVHAPERPPAGFRVLGELRAAAAHCPGVSSFRRAKETMTVHPRLPPRASVVFATIGAAALSACSGGSTHPASAAPTPQASAGDIVVSGGYVPQPASPDIAAAYLTLTNRGATADTLDPSPRPPQAA